MPIRMQRTINKDSDEILKKKVIVDFNFFFTKATGSCMVDIKVCG